MRENGMRARHQQRYQATTDPTHRLPVADNGLDRPFEPDAPNRIWTGDITHLATAEGWLYLAVVIDLFNHAVIGWSIKPRMTTERVLDALSMAWCRRRPAPGVLSPSDRGSQYASPAYPGSAGPLRHARIDIAQGQRLGKRTDREFLQPSEERAGSWRELYATRTEATSDRFQYIAVFSNRSRRHSTWGYLSPTPLLQNWLAAQNQQEMTA